ncbi:MAG: sulfite exporter TauE/SafE family protein [Longimicrobiales bacterium]
MTVLGLLFGLLVGLTLGLLGGGGSILTVPIFVFMLGIETKTAMTMSLAAVGITSLFGAFGHWRQGHINTRLALLFGAFAMTGSFVGGKLSRLFSGDVLLTVFGVVMLMAATFMARGRGNSDEERPPRSVSVMALPALVVGLLTGLIGVGGGFLIVPALVLLGGVPMKKAIGTSLLVIAMTALSGFAGHLTEDANIHWGLTALFTAAAIIGTLAGTRLVPHIPQRTLRKSFALFLIVMALLILYQKRAVFLGT